MDSEGLGPSPEDMELPASQETDHDNSDIFEKVVRPNSEYLLEEEEVVTRENEKYFVVTKGGQSDSYHRTYFAQAIDQETEEIFFQRVADAFISENQEVYFLKAGRPTRFWDETEELGFTNEFREDKKEFDLSYTLMDIKQDERGSDETDGSSLEVIYDPRGNLFFVAPRHKDLPQRTSFTSNPFNADDDNLEAMEEIKRAAEENSTLEASEIKLGVTYTSDREGFKFTMYNKQGEADYIVVVPLHVNVTEIMEETGALNLLRNPTQPSEGIQGQGIGDTDWRYKSFSELTGVKLTAAKL